MAATRAKRDIGVALVGGQLARSFVGQDTMGSGPLAQDGTPVIIARTPIPRLAAAMIDASGYSQGQLAVLVVQASAANSIWSHLNVMRSHWNPPGTIFACE